MGGDCFQLCFVTQQVGRNNIMLALKRPEKHEMPSVTLAAKSGRSNQQWPTGYQWTWNVSWHCFDNQYYSVWNSIELWPRCPFTGQLQYLRQVAEKPELSAVSTLALLSARRAFEMSHCAESQHTAPQNRTGHRFSLIGTSVKYLHTGRQWSLWSEIKLIGCPSLFTCTLIHSFTAVCQMFTHVVGGFL